MKASLHHSVVRFLLRLPIVRVLHQRQLLLPLLVLALVAAVLSQGALDRSPPAQAVQAPVVEEPAPRPVLRADLEKTPLQYQADYWNQLAEQAGPSLTEVGPSRTPAVLVGPRLALTTVRPALEIVDAIHRVQLLRPEPTATPEVAVGPVTGPDGDPPPPPTEASPVMADDGPTAGPMPLDAVVTGDHAEPLRLRGWDAEVGLALFEVTGADEVAFTLSDPGTLPSGSYLGAVTLDAAGDPVITPGYLVSSHSRTGDGDLVVSMDLPADLSIAGIITLDGALVGLAYVGPEGLRVVTASEALRLVQTLQATPVCRGFDVSDLSDEIRELVGVEPGVGALVEYVDPEAFGPQPVLVGGDILLEWGGESVQSAAQVTAMYERQTPGSLVSVRVFRGASRVTGAVVMHGPECRPLPAEPVRLLRFGLAAAWVPPRDYGSAPGWVVKAVAPDGPAARAGVVEGDRLQSVDQQALTDEQDRVVLETAAGSDESMLLGLERDGRTKLLAIRPLDATVDADPGPGDEVETDR